MGYLVVNSSRAIETCDDKSKTHLVLQTNGIPMPKTIFAPMTYENIGYTNYDFLNLVEQEIDYPIIIKECFGSFGMQVYKAENREQLVELVAKVGSKPMLFQEYIDVSEGNDIRIYVVGNQVVAAMKRRAVSGDFRTNISNGATMEVYEPSEELKQLAIRVAKIVGLDFAGIDFLIGFDGKPLVCEVNSNAHFRGIYECTGVNVADAIIGIYVEQST